MRALVVAMFVILVIGFVFFRGEASEDEAPDDSVPAASGTATSQGGEIGGGGSTGATDGSAAVATSSPGATIDPDLDPLQGIELDLVFDGFRQPTVLTAPEGTTGCSWSSG